MRNLLLLFFLGCILFANEIPAKFKDPRNCIACHKDQVLQWQTSLHAISHEDKNELYKKAVEFSAIDSHKSFEEMLVTCGTCHNPRLEIKSVADEFIIAKEFLGSNAKEVKEVNDAISAKHVKTGISCYICHNADSVKQNHSDTKSGYNALNFVTDDTIVGPFESNDRAGYHKTDKREHFISGNDLCLACHQGFGSANKFSLYEMRNEFQSSKSSDRCVDCHMKFSKNEIIAPTINKTTAVTRDIKDHQFSGVRNDPELLESAMEISLDKREKALIIKNLIPHRLPSGFSGRSIVVDVDYGENLKEFNEKFEIRAKYFDFKSDETLSYTAQNLVFDTRLKPLEVRKIPLKVPQKTEKINLEINYYALDPNLAKKLEIKDEQFLKPYLILKKEYIW